MLTNRLRVIATGLRMLTDCYELFTGYLRKNHSVDNRKKISDMSKIWPFFYRYLRMSASCSELFTDACELFTGACD